MDPIYEAFRTTEAFHAWMAQHGLESVSVSEIAALREDKARLDWIASKAECCECDVRGDKFTRWTVRLPAGSRDLRVALDSALKS